MTISMIGVTLGGAGALWIGRADGATPITDSEGSTALNVDSTELIPSNEETNLMDIIYLKLLIQNQTYEQRTNDDYPNSNRDNNTTPHKKALWNSWCVMLA